MNAAKVAVALRMLADAIDEEIDPVAPEHYSTAEPPPRVSRRRFNELARDVPGAMKHGREWRVPRAAWDAWRAEQGRKPRRIVRAPVPNATAAMDPALADVEAAGWRTTRPH